MFISFSQDRWVLCYLLKFVFELLFFNLKLISSQILFLKKFWQLFGMRRRVIVVVTLSCSRLVNPWFLLTFILFLHFYVLLLVEVNFIEVQLWLFESFLHLFLYFLIVLEYLLVLKFFHLLIKPLLFADSAVKLTGFLLSSHHFVVVLPHFQQIFFDGLLLPLNWSHPLVFSHLLLSLLFGFL